MYAEGTLYDWQPFQRKEQRKRGGNEIIKNFPEFKEIIPEIERANPLSSDINKRDSDTSW